MDGEIVTIEIPNAVFNAWEKHDDFQSFHQDFVGRNPPAKSFKGQKGIKKDGNKQLGPKLPPKKRRLAADLSDCIVDLDQVAPAADDETLCSVPSLNARAATKLSTMPVLCITKKLGAFIKNESGHDVT